MGKRKQVRDLEAKLLELENRIQVAGTHDEAPHHSPRPRSPSGSFSEEASSAARPSNSSPWPGPSDDGFVPDVSTTDNHHAQGLLEDVGLPPVSPDGRSGHESVPDHLVSSDLLRELTTRYFDKAHHGSPMLHRSRYMSSLLGPLALRPPIFLQYAIAATGASADAAHESLALSLYQRARTLAERDEMNETSTGVAHAQCWLLIANLEAQAGNFPRASISLARSVRTAQIMNLHQLDRGQQRPSLFSQFEPPRDWIETEERRRTWWVIYIADRLVFATSGLPALIDDRQVHTMLPATEEGFQNGKEEDTSTLQHSLRGEAATNSRLAVRVLASYLFYKAVDLESKLDATDGQGEDEYWVQQQDIDGDLVALIARLPPTLRFPRNLRCQHAVFINVLIHTATMCLHKTAIRRARDHEGLDAEFIKIQGRSRVLAAASQILAVFRLASDVAEALRNPIQVYAAYIAALVFLEDFVVGGNIQSKENALFFLETLRGVSATHAVAQTLAGHLMREMNDLSIQTPEMGFPMQAADGHPEMKIAWLGSRIMDLPDMLKREARGLWGKVVPLFTKCTGEARSLLNMVSRIALHLLATASVAFGAEVDFFSSPRSYIVEYAQGITKRDNIFGANDNVKVLKDYHSTVFYGANVETESYSLEDIAALPNVARVWPNRIFKPTQSETVPDADLDPTLYDVHNFTGVRALHDKGIFGKGVKVAVVDTGIDYTHPDLGGGFGKGFKVEGGYDFAGNGSWPRRGPKFPDEDPMDIMGHGSHVAGIVAGKGKNWSGVAPEATLYAYKTSALPDGLTDDAINIDAFLLAYEDGVDIITASIGLGGGWSEGAWEEVATRLAKEGIVITVSVGNGGERGPFSALSPASAKGVVAVANVIPNQGVDGKRKILSEYSTSWGPLFDLQIKPDVGAPGAYIYSVDLNGGYRLATGTSMSTPYVAGIAALYIGQYGGRKTHGKGFAEFMHRRLVSNSLKVMSNLYDEQAAAVSQVGTGMVNASQVLSATTDLIYEPMALNDTRYFSRYHKVTVINNGDKDVEYSFTKEDAMGADTLGSNYPNSIRGYWEMNLVPYSVNATLPSKFVLKPGTRKVVTVAFQNPDKAGWPAESLPLYSGNIVINGNNGYSWRVPFLGAGGDLKRLFRKMFYEQPRLESMIPPVQYSNKSTFSFNISNQDFPRIYAGIGFGTRQLRYDIFERGWNERKWSWPLVAGKNGYVGSGTWWVGAGQVPQWFDTQGWNPDETNDYPNRETDRNSADGYSEYWWFGKLANGTKIANGDYTLRFAALIPFGRPEASDSWDTFTVPFSVTGQYDSLV
ncbi:C6 finger domain transcription factor dbaA [Paramyrothecium foliicola]|nr:C6 finger domain transcription factor dbaA [Paramyrothecium foliicola]